MGAGYAVTDESAFPEMRARAPWWGGDLQTLRNKLVGADASLTAYPSRRLELATSDGSGDRLQAVLNLPVTPRLAPLIVLVHGLTGCEDSQYLRASAAGLLERGHAVARLNMRGAGPSRATCRRFYHAGCSHDLRDALAGLAAEVGPEIAARGVVLIGYSLAGNVVLRYLAEEGEARPTGGGLRPLAAAVVSTPIDLALAAETLMRGRNYPYQRWLLGHLKRGSTTGGAELSAAEHAAILGARSIPEFDDRFTAPRNGFTGVDDYYRRCSAPRFMAVVRVPTLVIHARDDPWIPARTYQAFDWAANPRLTPLLPATGGHVGFHGRGHRRAWHDRCIAAFLAARLGDPV